MGVAYSMHYIFSSIRRYYTFYATVSKIMFAKIIIALDKNYNRFIYYWYKTEIFEIQQLIIKCRVLYSSSGYKCKIPYSSIVKIHCWKQLSIKFISFSENEYLIAGYIT